MVSIKDGALTKIAENKIAGAIYKVIRTSQDDYALACSGGLHFVSYDNRHKKFSKSPDFLLSDHLVTQVYEISNNKYAVGCWGVPWIGIVDRLKRSLIKIDCPLQDETQCTDLIPLPNFNPVGFPFILIRNSKAVNLVNLATFSMHRLLTR